jgi:hypothetical protein
MSIDELKTIQGNIEAEFKNLSDHSWVADKLKALKVQYDIISDIIKKLEGEQHAPVTTNKRRQKSSPNSNS